MYLLVSIVYERESDKVRFRCLPSLQFPKSAVLYLCMYRGVTAIISIVPSRLGCMKGYLHLNSEWNRGKSVAEKILLA